MKKTVSILFIIVLISVSTSVFAYNYWTNNAKLVNGVSSQKYYISHNYFDGRNYGGPIRDAVTQWNTKVVGTREDMTNVYFTENSTRSGSVADFMIADYGTTGWNGVAAFFRYDSGQINQDGRGPTQNYNWTRLSLNNTYLNDDLYSDISATAKHEFGHALGLAHSGTLNAIMYRNRDRTTKNVESDDVTGVKRLY